MVSLSIILVGILYLGKNVQPKLTNREELDQYKLKIFAGFEATNMVERSSWFVLLFGNFKMI